MIGPWSCPWRTRLPISTPLSACSDPCWTGFGSGKVYFIVDKASKDNTSNFASGFPDRTPRFVTVWAPENKNVVDAYMRGVSRGLRRRPRDHHRNGRRLSTTRARCRWFLRVLNEGNECAFGSRFCNGG